MRIPPFQRALRWKPADALQLIDSLYRSYPIGTLLFWEAEAEPGEEQLGTLRIQAGGRPDALWVVDGQQRIVALSRVLLSALPENDQFSLYFDLDNEKFSPPPNPAGRKRDPARWIPMTEVLDAERLMHWLLDHSASDQRTRLERAIQLGRRIREFEIPACLIRTRNEQVLREVFERINFSGKRLEASEIFDALHGSRGAHWPTTIAEIANDLEALHFGHIEESVLYQLLLALQGIDAAKGSSNTPPRLSGEIAASAYRETARAAADAIHFIKDAGIPRYELLPYKRPLVILGKFFHYHPTPNPRSRQLLVRWLWRGALSGAHRGYTAAARVTHGRIDPLNEERSVQCLLESLNHQIPAPPDVTLEFNIRWANSKLQALALLALAPRDLKNGKPLSPNTLTILRPSSNNLQVPRILPSEEGSPLFFCAANRIIHPALRRLREQLIAVTDPAIFRSHGITKEAVSSLRAGDTLGFLRQRAEHLAAHFEKFFAERARWEESDRPSLASLIVDEEG
ncbi:hypothetical protein JCM17961_25030 [Endothiovibrio diazotrophicus]